MKKTSKSPFWEKYPRLIFLFLTFAFAYAVLAGERFLVLREILSSAGYLGTFFAGICYSYGFTAAPATAVLMVLSERQNIVVAAVIAAIGSLFADMVIYTFFRSSLSGEFKMLSKEKVVVFLSRCVPSFLRGHLLLAMGIFVIASPLPDELGVLMLAASGALSMETFSIMSFTLNFLGIFAVLLLGRMIF